MAETEYSTTTELPVETVWAFVSEMDQWATMLTGYKTHEKQSQTDSLWTLKGDIGALARVVRFQVHITEWNGPSRVAFDLKGLNEPLEGGGTFELRTRASGEAESASPARGGGPVVRFFQAIVRALMRWFGDGASRRATVADSMPGESMAELRFRLEVNPGGPMAPMVNALMKPAMLPAAEQLAEGIMARLEEIHGTKA